MRLFDVALLPLAEAIATDATLLRDFLAEARHPSVIVFFDEIHLLAAPAVSNLAQALKPSLARGEIACIGATTGEEYQANIEPDAALARRFTPDRGRAHGRANRARRARRGARQPGASRAA